MEDNDPTGYKSNKAKDAKKALGMKPIEFPKYSPDLNPLDFFLWSEVERRLALQRTPAKETIEHFKARLRRTALAIPAPLITKAVKSIRDRARAVVAAKGGDIPRD